MANQTALLIWNGCYKLYSGDHHLENSCWAVVSDINTREVQTAATQYAQALGHL